MSANGGGGGPGVRRGLNFFLETDSLSSGSASVAAGDLLGIYATLHHRVAPNQDSDGHPGTEGLHSAGKGKSFFRVSESVMEMRGDSFCQSFQEVISLPLPSLLSFTLVSVSSSHRRSKSSGISTRVGEALRK